MDDIPIRIENDHRVSGCKIQPKTSRPCRKQKDETGRVGCIVPVHTLLTLLRWRRAVESQREITTIGKVVFQNRHDGRHLGKHEYAVASSLELREHLVQQSKLA